MPSSPEHPTVHPYGPTTGPPSGGGTRRPGRRQGLDEAQCRKWRRPVRTTAMSCSRQAARTSSSRTEPPGWITAVTADWAARSMPSRNGKNASLAMTDPRARSPALQQAMSTESTRDIWPAPIPTVALPLARTIAFDFTLAATVHANRRSRHSSSVGWRSPAIVISWRAGPGPRRRDRAPPGDDDGRGSPAHRGGVAGPSVRVDGRGEGEVERDRPGQRKGHRGDRRRPDVARGLGGHRLPQGR